MNNQSRNQKPHFQYKIKTESAINLTIFALLFMLMIDFQTIIMFLFSFNAMYTFALNWSQSTYVYFCAVSNDTQSYLSLRNCCEKRGCFVRVNRLWKNTFSHPPHNHSNSLTIPLTKREVHHYSSQNRNRLPGLIFMSIYYVADFC